MHQLSSQIPSKTFLFGEYAVLFGGTAFVLSHSPEFLIKGSDLESNKSEVHKLSPAGKLLGEFGKKLEVALKDPHQKKGGFGRSTAEFLSAYKEVYKTGSVESIYAKYMSFFKDHSTQPSGADLVAQIMGEHILFTKEPFSYEVTSWPFPDVSLILCHTNNKVETHDHLNKDLKSLDFTKLVKISRRGSESILKQNFLEFLSSLSEFALEQESLGLLHQNTLKITSQLNGLNSVIFARGCGALGADVVAILTKKEVQTEDLSSSFKELNLDVICRI